MLLDIRKISRTYNSQNGVVRAVNDVSLSIDVGQFVGVVGPSGCGKSTLLLTAGGLLSPTSGEVLINGQNPYDLPPNRRAGLRAEQIGFVFQQFHLVPYLSVLDNVLSASIATSLPNARERAEELIAHFGLEHRIHHVPGQLSTGERQRTALARALLNRPKILLADEPTGNLDGESARIVLGHLKEFASEGAVLLVTHDNRALEYAQQVIKMNEGEIVSD